MTRWSMGTVNRIETTWCPAIASRGGKTTKLSGHDTHKG